MKLRIRQTEKQLFSAKFNIYNEYDQPVGSINFCGSLASREGTFDIDIDQNHLKMVPTGRKEAAEHAKEFIKRSPFRPYRVSIGNRDGVVFHDQIKTGLFKDSGYHFLRIHDDSYTLYFVGFGEKGICAPIYENDTLVSVIRKPAVVENDLHFFELDVQKQNTELETIILCCYMYVITYYKAGEKEIRGIRRHNYVTKDKFLLEKCPGGGHNPHLM